MVLVESVVEIFGKVGVVDVDSRLVGCGVFVFKEFDK